MILFNQDLLVYMTKFISTSEYYKMIVLCKFIYKTLKKFDNYVWFNIINFTINKSILEKNGNYTIKIIKDGKNYGLTFPNNLKIKEQYKTFN
ncbi:hypothetical protein CL656_01615 [bacterium]|nr:hypothetical protein [bacterium]